MSETEKDRELCVIENEIHSRYVDMPEIFYARIMAGAESAIYRQRVQQLAEDIWGIKQREKII